MRVSKIRWGSWCWLGKLWGSKVPTLKGTEASLSYVQCFLYLVSPSVNVSIFHIRWLDTFWRDCKYVCICMYVYIHACMYLHILYIHLHISGALIFTTVSKETLPFHLALVAGRAYACVLTGLHIFAYFESCNLMIWYPVSANLGTDWDISFWDTDRFWHIINY